MPNAKLLCHDTLDCFPYGLTDEQGKEVHAEVSAVVYDGNKLIMASDKPIPGEDRSSVFSVDLCENGISQQSLAYYTTDLLARTRKYEDFALTAEGNHILATTGFDRIDQRNHHLNAYNHLLIWPLGEPEKVKVVDPDPRDGVFGSLELRDKLTEAIGTPYYKIEGLAAIPGENQEASPLLLFGVREMGNTHDDFDYVSRLVGAHYEVDPDGNLRFLDKLRWYYEFDPDGDPDVFHPCGLSSLEYDPFHDRLYLLTSFETSDESNRKDYIGGYLWSVSLTDFHAGRPPKLVHWQDGSVLTFDNKAEGLAILDEERLFIAYDNDRHATLGEIDPGRHRAACEAPYSILAIHD